MLGLLLAWLISSLAVGTMLLYAYKRRSIALIIMGSFIILQLQARPLLFLTGLDTPFPASQFDRHFWQLATQASLMGSMWTTLLLLAYMVFIRTKSGLAPIFPPAPESPNPRVAIALSTIATMLAISVTLLLVAQYGSVARFTYAVKVGRELVGLYYFREIATAAALICIYSILLNRNYLNKSRNKKNLKVNIKAFGFLSLLVIVNFATIFIWSNRINIGILVIIAIISWHFYVKKINFFKLVAYTSLFGLALARLRDLRFSMVSEVVGRDVKSNFTFWTDLSTSLHLAEYDAFLLALRDTGDRFPFRLGEDFINGFLALVPRFIYEDRENFYIGQWFRQIYQPGVTNGWPVTIVGEWYVNFNWAGLFLGAALSGYVAAAIDKVYNKPRTNPWHTVAAGGIAGFALNGGFWTGTPQKAAILLGMFWLMFVVMRVATKWSGRSDNLRLGSSRYRQRIAR